MIDSVSLSARLRAPGLDMQASSQASSQVASPARADFAQTMADVASEALDAVRGGEATAISGLRGQAPIQDVVEAVMAAERSLQTALALRDKAVSAYQEISRMAI